MVSQCFRFFSSVMLVFSLSSCVSHEQVSLYNELGGEEGIARIVDNFVTNIEYDAVIVEYFVGVDINVFRHQLTSQICQLSDGPCVYDGDSMEEVHKGQNISAAHFNRTVDLLTAAMAQVNIPYSTQNRLLQRLALLRNDIIHQ